MKREFELHMELRAADLERAGVEPADAARRARAEFGGVYNFSQLGREARGLGWFDAMRFSWLDLKLGGRMIVKHPGLTLMGTIAIGVAIAIGAGVSGAIATIKRTDLPLDEGDRVVGIQLYDVATSSRELRMVRDFAEWRGSLRSVTDLGAFTPTSLNLAGADGRGEGVVGAAMTASGFRVARTPPLLGRYLLDADEKAGAPQVVVLGYDVWRNRFDSDSAVVGKAVRIGSESHTVIGVMPKGFSFPVSHSMWVPLRLDALEYERRAGPVLYVFGRLDDGATLEDASAELATVSAAASRDHPATHRDLRARVLPYTHAWFRLDDPEIAQVIATIELVVVLLVVVVCVNVATLVYARTATRQREIAVRTALGATRGRIIAQLFGEACVLGSCGAGIGLVLVSVIGSQIERALAQLGVTGIPFWVHFDVSLSTLAYVVGLTLLGAVIMGVLPALQVTGPRVQGNLQQLAAGQTTLKMGRVWTTLIVVEVAIAVALLSPAIRFTAEWLKTLGGDAGFAVDRYVAATIVTERWVTSPEGGQADSRAGLTRYAQYRDGLVARLEAEPDVALITYANTVPGSEDTFRYEREDDALVASADTTGAQRKQYVRARYTRVERQYFDAFDIRFVAGRGFGPADADSGASAVIVNRAFADSAFRGGNAIGQRLRNVPWERGAPPGEWLEIVGVVNDFPAELPFPGIPIAAIYSTADIGRMYPTTLMVRLNGDPTTFAQRLLELASSTQPELLVRGAAPLGDRMRARQLPLQWLAVSLAVVTFSVLMLSCAGVYALMAMVVTQRRREIGIRVALGADPRRMLWALFSRAAVQVGRGVLVGLLLAVAVNGGLSNGEVLGTQATVILGTVALFMGLIAMVAALQPARVALSIPPTEALKSD